jgi:ATP-dependent protease ClpP protease subunit
MPRLSGNQKKYAGVRDRDRLKMKNKNDKAPIQEATKTAKECFGKMRDIDFFSNRVNHLYFYGPVTRDSVLKLKMHIREANRDVALVASSLREASATPHSDPVFVSPKPIVIHVNSFGGEAHAMNTIYSAFLESKMPICALVDGVSASASTILSAGAPYRVIAPSSASLFHEWSMSFTGSYNMRKPDMHMLMTEMSIHDKGYYEAVQPKSKMSKDELDSLVKRDLFLNAKQTLQKGFADRLLKFDRTKQSSSSKSNVRELLRDSNVNHVTIMPSKIESESNEVDPVILELDRILQLDADTRKPTVVHFNQGYYEDVDHKMIHSFYGKMVPLLTRIRAVSAAAPQRGALVASRREASGPGPVVGVVDSIIDVVSVIPFLHCNVRAMYESAIFVIHLVYGSSSAKMIDDDIENTKNAFAEVRKLLSERTKLPKKIIDEMHRTRIVMNAQQCLQYGIADVLL